MPGAATYPATRPLLSRRGAQAAIAAAGSIAIGAAWLSLQEPLGKAAILLLLLPLGGALLPLVNAPFELALAFMVLSYFRLHEVFPILFPLHLPELTAIGALGALGWHLLGTRRVRPYWSPELVFLLLFFAHVTAGVAFASDRPVAFAVWSGSFVKVVAITLAIAWLATGPAQFARACRACVAAGLVVGAVALWNKAHGIDLVEGTRVTIGRGVDSILGDPNDLALVLLFPASFALGLLCTRGLPRLDRLFGLGTFLVLALAILATQSRGGLLGLVAVLAPFVRRRVRSNLVLLLLVGLAAAALFAAAHIGERTLLAAGGGEDLDESAQNRLWAWETGLNMALAHPLNGVGIGTFEANYFFYTEHWLGRDYVAHSTWFQVLGETGFPGLLLYATMIGLGAGHLLRAERRLRGAAPPGGDAAADAFTRALVISLLAGLAGFVAAGTFLSQAFTWPIYVILALGAAVSHHAASAGSANRKTQAGERVP